MPSAKASWVACSSRFPAMVAIAVFAVAALLHASLLPQSADFGFLTFYPASLVCFVLFEPWIGVGVTLISAIVGYAFFAPTFPYPRTEGIANLSVSFFFFSTVAIGALISRLKSTAADLTKSERMFSRVLEDQSDLICRFHADGRIFYVNDAYCAYFGRPKALLVGFSWQPVAWAEDLKYINAKLGELKPDNPTVVIENRVMSDVHGLRWCQFINHASYDADGRLIETLSVGRDITALKESELTAVTSQFESDDLYTNAPCGYHSLDADGCYLKINSTELAWLGLSEDEVIGKHATDFMTPGSKFLFRANFPKFLNSGRLENLELEFVGRSSTKTVSLSASSLRDDHGNFVMSRSILYDITNLKAARSALQQVVQEQGAMLDCKLIGFAKVHDRKIMWVNRTIVETFGYSEFELVGGTTRKLFADDAAYRRVGTEAYPLLASKGVFRAQLEMVRKDGERLWIDLSGVALAEGTDDSFWSLSDITVLKKQKEAIEFGATHDALTGLPNRTLIFDRLSQMLLQARRAMGTFSVCYVDLDGFKAINDQYGHAAGDKVLKTVGNRLQSIVRENDTVGRLGGDEFVILLYGLEEADNYLEILQRAILEAQLPIEIAPDLSVTVSASIGAAVFPADGSQAEELLSKADRAMYAAKDKGGSLVCRHSSEEVH